MKLLAVIYNSLLWALTLAAVLFGSEWLEMRVNMAYILLAGWLVFFAAIWGLTRAKKWRISLALTAANTAACLALGLLVLGPGRLGVVPAAIIREGLHMGRLPFSTINTVLVVLLLAMLLVLCIGEAGRVLQKKETTHARRDQEK